MRLIAVSLLAAVVWAATLRWLMAECTHLDSVEFLDLPDEVEGCEECLAQGMQLGPPADVPELRPHRLLRQLDRQTRHRPLRGDAATRSSARPSPGEDWSWCYPDELMFRCAGMSPILAALTPRRSPVRRPPQQRRRGVGGAPLQLELSSSSTAPRGADQLGHAERAQRPVEAEPHRRVHVLAARRPPLPARRRPRWRSGRRGGGGSRSRRGRSAASCSGSRVGAAIPSSRVGLAFDARRRRSSSPGRSCGRACLPRPAVPGSGSGASAPARRPGRRRSGRWSRLTSRPIRSISSNGPMRKPPPRRTTRSIVGGVGDAVAEHPQRLQREGAGEPVGDEAGGVPGPDRGPAHRLARPRSSSPAPPPRSAPPPPPRPASSAPAG